jgi:hypothetical protein
VIRFFRLMGVNYQGRINQVLRAFMLARLAKVVPGPEDIRYQPSRRDRYHLGVAEFFGQVQLQNHRLAQGRKCKQEELKLRRMLSHLLDEEIALNLTPEERAIPEGMIQEFLG